MVVEIAAFEITPGREAEFADAYAGAKHLLEATDGFRTARMTRGVESPSRFVLLVEWDTVEAHEKGFRASERFGAWRAAIGPFFAAPPVVEHYADV